MNTDIENLFKDKVIGHPAGLFVIFFTEMWERFSFYGMKILLVLFLTAPFLSDNPGWEWSRENALALIGTYSSLLYLTPIVGGWLADDCCLFSLVFLVGALFRRILGWHANPRNRLHPIFYVGNAPNGSHRAGAVGVLWIALGIVANRVSLRLGAGHVGDGVGTEGDDDVSALKAGAGSGLAVGGSVDAHALAVVEVVGHDSEGHLEARRVAGAALGFGERNLWAAVEVANHGFDEFHYFGEAFVIDQVRIVTRLVVVGVLAGEEVQHRYVGQIERGVV